MPTSSREIYDKIKHCLGAFAGSEYNELKYVDDVSQNSFTGGRHCRYGVRPGATPEVGDLGTTRHLTYTQTFEFVLTKGYKHSALSDQSKYDAFFTLHEIALGFYNKTFQTRLGIPNTALNVTNLVISEPEFLDDDKVVVLVGSFDITYRLNF